MFTRTAREKNVPSPFQGGTTPGNSWWRGWAERFRKQAQRLKPKEKAPERKLSGNEAKFLKRIKMKKNSGKFDR